MSLNYGFLNDKIERMEACRPSAEHLDKVRDAMAILFKSETAENLRKVEEAVQKVIDYYEPDMSPVFMNIS